MAKFSDALPRTSKTISPHSSQNVVCMACHIDELTGFTTDAFSAKSLQRSA
jgi:hypothetical protein